MANIKSQEMNTEAIMPSQNSKKGQSQSQEKHQENNWNWYWAFKLILHKKCEYLLHERNV